MAAKRNRVSLRTQEYMLRNHFPNSVITRNQEKSLIWICTLQPTLLSMNYTVKVELVPSRGVRVYVINPKPLLLAKGEDELPHVYSTRNQQLCLFYPKNREWRPELPLVRTIIPWIVEWLYFYEIWLGGNGWQGGGIEHGEDDAEITEELTTNNPSQG